MPHGHITRHVQHTSVTLTRRPVPPVELTDVSDPLDKTKGSRKGPSGLATKKTGGGVGGATPSSLIGMPEGTSEHPPHVVLQLHEEKVTAIHPQSTLL